MYGTFTLYGWPFRTIPLIFLFSNFIQIMTVSGRIMNHLTEVK